MIALKRPLLRILMLTLLGACPLLLSAQNIEIQSDDDKPIEERLVYTRQNTFKVAIHSQGFGIGFNIGKIKTINPKANVVVTPSDHVVTNGSEFRRIITSCLDFTSETDAIVTLGMKPTRPETGYGYIQADLSASSARNREIYRVDSFREKPDAQTAEKYIRNKSYFGMPASSSGG